LGHVDNSPDLLGGSLKENNCLSDPNLWHTRLSTAADPAAMRASLVLTAACESHRQTSACRGAPPGAGRDCSVEGTA
jgi:hypothetical protein